MTVLLAAVVVVLAFWLLSALAGVIIVVFKVGILLLALIGAWYLIHRKRR